MKLFIAVFICKIAYFIGSKIGRGSSLPGKVALRICPDALRRLVLPQIVIAVTGSNGKTSTSEFIAHVLKSSGLRTGWNREGSNQTEGIATLLLRLASLRGKVKRDAIVMECDERYAAEIFSFICPSALVITNLCRDQLTRNGHHEFIQDCLRTAAGNIAGNTGGDKAVSAALQTATGSTGTGTTLVLNCDDPYAAALGYGKTGINRSGGANCGGGGGPDADSNGVFYPDIIWYGAGEGINSGSKTGTGVYDDGAFCPCCKARMKYLYRITAHFGAYSCDACGFERQKPAIEAVTSDIESGDAVIAYLTKTGTSNNETGRYDETKLRLNEPNLNNLYNVMAAIAAVSTAGIGADIAAKHLDLYKLTGGRTVYFDIGGRDTVLLICKHENSMAYNNALAWITKQGEPCSVILFVNDISRKYYTCETSWLWDIDFDILSNDIVKEVIMAGRYYGELMMRFAMSEVDAVKCRSVSDNALLREAVMQCDTQRAYVLTCFADKKEFTRLMEQN